MDFKAYLQESANELNQQIDEILLKWLSEVKKTNTKLVPLALAFINACKGGKRIRGTLVKLGYELTRNHLRGEIVKVGAAYEILHTALLIHDDIIDKSPTRRDQPSLYKSIGISKALTLADYGFFLAIKIISESKFPLREKDGTFRKSKAVTLLVNTMVDTAIGQMLDILHADPEMVARLKTARYSIAGPLQLGATLAGADKKLLGLLGRLGENLGIAFQIRDDILDGEALDNARHLGVKYVLRAKLIIPQITKERYMKRLLTEMADFLVERNR